MSFLFHDSGESAALQILFSGEQSVATTFGLGLASDTLTEADRVSDILGEPYGTESGYSRQLLAVGATDFTVSPTAPSWQAAMSAVTFTASGANMGTVNRWFLTDEGLSGELGGSANLYASGDVSPARTINDGDSLALTAYLQLK